MLGRPLIRSARGLLFQTDSKHCSSVVQDLNARSRRRSMYPRRKLTSVEKSLLDIPLDDARASLFRSCTGRLIYASLDRPDLGHVVKALAGEMQKPTEAGWLQLDAVARYLVDRESIITSYEPEFESGHVYGTVKGFCDADWAGGSDRKSTSGGCISWCGMILGHWSRTQSTYALSTCESEFHSSVSCVQEGLYTVGILEELGFTTKLFFFSDSSAALGLMQQPGVSRPMRHLEVKYLFIQELLYLGKIRASKIDGLKNCSDILTKLPTKDMLDHHLAMFSLMFVPAEMALSSSAKAVKITKAS